MLVYEKTFTPASNDGNFKDNPEIGKSIISQHTFLWWLISIGQNILINIFQM